MSLDPNAIKLEKSPSGGRYIYPFPDGSEAEMVYVERSGVATITHTGTPPQHRGQGVAAALVAKAAGDFRAAGQKVIPSCWFARQEFQAHAEWADLLYRG